MKVKDLIALLQAQDQEAEAVVCGMDGAYYSRVSEVAPRTLCKISSVCGQFEEESRCGAFQKALSAPFAAVFIDSD